MLIIVPAVALVALFLWLLLRPEKGQNYGSRQRSRYEETGSFMDFDPGVDADKVGDPRYPSAGVHSVMKEEFMEDLLDRK